MTIAYSVLFLRGVQGNLAPAPPAAKKRVSKAAGPPAKPFLDSTLSMLMKGSLFSGAISIAADRNGYEHASRLRTVFHTLSTFTTYVWGANTLPAAVTKIFHPLVASCLLTLGVVQVTGMATGSTFTDVLKTYRVKSLNLMEIGAGDILLFLLGPTVVSFAMSMYDRRKLLKENFLIVIAAMLVSSLGCLYGTAAFVRLIALGGSEGGGDIVRLSLLMRNVTTALGIEIAKMFGGDVAIAARYVL